MTAVSATGPVRPGELRPGAAARVRDAADILATLDEKGTFEGVPFMPEMLQHVGRTFTVYKRLEKICDYGGAESRSRRMTGTVLFRENRCDGTAHGGCEAECRIFWKEAWLEHPDGDPAPRPQDPQAVAALKTLVSAHVKSTREDGKDIYSCQITTAPAASTSLRESDLSQYIREIRAGNITVPHFLRVALRAVAGRLARLLRLSDGLPLPVAGEQRVDGTQLGLQPGEWVRVRSKEEISKTLDKNVRHRGLAFTEEMTPVVGKVFRVHSRVGRLVHERTGELLELKNECIALDGMLCSGDFTRGAWFCPRDHYPLWREAWLERVDPPSWAKDRTLPPGVEPS